MKKTFFLPACKIIAKKIEITLKFPGNTTDTCSLVLCFLVFRREKQWSFSPEIVSPSQSITQ